MPDVARRGPGRPPAANSADTRDRIVQAARTVFGELGYDAATFQEIAQRSGLTRPAVNHYFPSKRVLYREVVTQTLSMVVAAGVEGARREATLPARLRAFIRIAVAAQGHDRSAGAFMVTSVLEGQRHPKLSEDGNDALEATREFLSWALRDAAASGELRQGTDLEVATDTLAAMLWGLGLYGGFVVTQERLVAMTDEYLRILTDSLCP